MLGGTTSRKGGNSSKKGKTQPTKKEGDRKNKNFGKSLVGKTGSRCVMSNQ